MSKFGILLHVYMSVYFSNVLYFTFFYSEYSRIILRR